MKIEIENKNIGLPSKIGTYIKLRSEFDIGADTSRVFWRVFDNKDVVITYGTIEVPSEIHLNWGVDDSIVIDYALNYLGLTKKI